MRTVSSIIKSLIIVALLIALVVGGVFVYVNYIDPNSGQHEELPSGTISGDVSGNISDPGSGDISSGDVGSGDVDVPEDPADKELRVTIPFDSKFAGSSAYQVILLGQDYWEEFDNGNKPVIYVEFDCEEKVSVLEDENNNGYMSVVEDEENLNRFQVTFEEYQFSVSFSSGDEEMSVLFILVTDENVSVLLGGKYAN